MLRIILLVPKCFFQLLQDKFAVKFHVKHTLERFVVNIKFPLATYHTIVPSTEELYCLNAGRLLPKVYFLALLRSIRKGREMCNY